MTEDRNPRICERCRVVAVYETDPPRWVHPLAFQKKFSLSVCDHPVPGRDARPGELRYGRGRTYLNDKFTLFDKIPELAQQPDTPLIVGVDASYKMITEPGRQFRKPISWAFLTTAGTYGLGTTTRSGRVIGGERSTQGELRAIWWALLSIPKSHPLTVITDSLDAVELMDAWRAGEEAMPRGYTTERESGRQATLVQLAHLVYEAGDRITTQWVRGHTGQPMNEGADRLAKLARAWATGRRDRAEVAEQARAMVLTALLHQAEQGETHGLAAGH